MTDRITGVVLLAFTAWYGVTAWGIQRGFFSDPLGSRPFPLAVAILLAPLALYVLFGSLLELYLPTGKLFEGWFR